MPTNLTQGYRQLRPGQCARLNAVEVDSGRTEVLATSTTMLFEAPNWSPDGGWLLVNGDGLLHRVPATGGEPEAIRVPGLPGVNNDHVLAPDGRTVYASAFDSHLYAVDLVERVARRVSNDHGEDFVHFLHGVSPDQQTLAYIGMSLRADGSVLTNVFTIPAGGGADRQLTDDAFPDDSCEFSPDGAWIYFNSERAATVPGHAQLFRMRPDGSQVAQLTTDERVNWFAHPSPDGSRIAYLSFPPGTTGHPADLPVIIRLLETDGGVRDLVELFGGQGTINVPSWDPTGRRLAYVDYPTGS